MKSSNVAGACAALASCMLGCDPAASASREEALHSSWYDPVKLNASTLIEEGRETFRYDTFGSEAFFGDALLLHEAIAGEENGGVGPGLSPNAALALGLKVDVAQLPRHLVRALRRGEVDLDSPGTTLALLEQDAVVGLEGIFVDGTLRSVGVECAFCHSTVDDSFAPGIGLRRDGWPNRDLDVGAILALSPDLGVVTDALGVDDATLRTVLASWGPGKYDAHVFLDGKALRPDGATAAVLIPAAFGLLGVNLATYEGWGSITYWNAFVANLQMHGSGTFIDARLDDAAQYPLAAAQRLGHVRNPDRISGKLAALELYQLALPVPCAPEGSYDAEAAERGREVFEGRAQCAGCHVPPLFTEPGWNMHTAAEIGVDDFQATRGPEARYRTTPLRGLFTRASGGFYHDGRFPTLEAVVDHYDSHLGLGLSGDERTDLLEYLKSL